MRKSLILIFLALMLLVTACSQKPTAAPTSAPTQVITVVSETAQPTTAPIPTSGPATCKVSPMLPSANPRLAAAIPPVSDRDQVIGPKDAKITLMEFSDFQCPYCSILSPILEAVAKNNPKDVRFVYRHFPLPTHPLSLLAAQAAEAAGKQGKFWEMHDVIFKEQKTWGVMDIKAFQTWLTDQAKTLGLKSDQFVTDMTGDELVKYAKDAQTTGVSAGINYTPFLTINGTEVPGEFHGNSPEKIQSIIEAFRFADKVYKECPPLTVDKAKKYNAVLKTEKGDITIQLFADKAPWAVNSFIYLVKNNYYDGVRFFRVLPGFVAQTGDPLNTGLGNPGYKFSNEISDLRFDKEGVVGMANSGPDSNGSQFFITLGDSKNLSALDGKYTIFGQVTQGLDVVKNITPRDPQNPSADMPAGDKILGISITEN